MVAVKQVLMRDYDTATEPSLTPFIDIAGALVDDLVAAATTAPTTARLELLERWLAAHYYALSDQPFMEEWDSQGKAKYQGETGKYLEATKYGQAAVGLDSTGYLSRLARGVTRVSAGMTWLGKPPSEQTRYEDRD